jgi:uncharacterized protein (TIGR03000 family)
VAVVAAPAVAVAAAPSATGKVVVQMPADARLYVDGQLANLTSNPRAFVTPSLTAGRDYYYTLRAEAVRDGEVVSESKRVIVRAGGEARVAFDDLVARAPETKPAAARITVRLPVDAQLFVNGEACSLTSSIRAFSTPVLQPGREYAYTLRAEVVRDGQTRTESRRVVFEAGKQVTVEFKLAPLSVASR